MSMGVVRHILIPRAKCRAFESIVCHRVRYLVRYLVRL